MSDLSATILDILASVTSPMRSDSLGRVLFCTGSVLGYGEPTTEKQIDLALEELVSSGKVERILRRGTAIYQTTRGKMIENGDA